MLKFLQDYLAPTNRLWQGKQKTFLPLVLVKYLLTLVILVLCISEIVLQRIWIVEDYGTDSYYDFSYWYLRWGLPVFMEIAHIIAQAICIATNNNHPIFALVGSICGFGLWLSFAVLDAIVAYSGEFYFTHMDSWESLCYAESGLMAVMTMLYVAMLVFSSMAVHRYRKSKQCTCKVHNHELDDVEANRDRVPADAQSVQSATTLYDPRQQLDGSKKGMLSSE
ncbi:hypothetical protein K491DRAFT_710336 [Lophiostoma macrostomum CBS 122681]|uniref:MARVEL domain-containing protein n=1 Tax=Lophiostoma macrostomum CBS 122681 TaxID=1314788 RepID=A0A6A6TPC1_9PLEO|nr:hypothetical protein K491DRAFT_710336 [Lophiostoma macrostomum CBS 122681]